MKKHLLLFAWIFVPAATTAVAHENPADTARNDAGWLWEISGNGLSQKSYLFGTCHGDAHDFTIEEVLSIKGLEETLGNVKLVMFEGGLNPEKNGNYDDNIKEFRRWFTNPGPKWLMPEGTYYKQLFDSLEHFNELNKFLTDEMKDAVYWKKNPTYWLSRIMFRQVFSRKWGKAVDALLKEEVQQRGIEVGYVESVESPGGSLFSLFTDTTGLDTISLTLKEQAEALYRYIHAISSNDPQKNRINELSTMYLQNDTCRMSAWLKEIGQIPGMEENDPLKKKIGYDRNVAWIPLIEKKIAARPTMIAVGCRHLLGSQSLIAMLRRKGYTVEPIE